MSKRTAELGDELISFAERFRVDADVMECRRCRTRQHICYAHEDMLHRDGCRETDVLPWHTYTGLIAQVLPAAEPLHEKR